MRMMKPTVKIPYEEILKTEDGKEIVRTNHGHYGTVEFRQQQSKAERKELKKRIKFYTRQAKRNKFLSENGFDAFVKLDTRQFV